VFIEVTVVPAYTHSPSRGNVWRVARVTDLLEIHRLVFIEILITNVVTAMAN
jgi:hypothetical protein